MFSAEGLKALGTQSYKQGNFKDAISQYKRASELEPTAPVYLSNLSAAQFEDGQYWAASQTCLQVLTMLSSNDTALRPKIEQRLEKSRLFSNHHETLIDDHPELTDPSRARAFQRQEAAKLDMETNRVNARIASLPRYRASQKEILEYYVVGHDPVSSMLRSQHTGLDPSHPDVRARHIKIPRNGAPFTFSTFFCGIGDARHMYGTIMDLGQDCPTPLPKEFNVHFTAVDVHPTALARDLVVLFTLNELATFKNPDVAKRPKYLLTMLHYMYLAALMPPAAARVLDEMVEKVHGHVSRAVNAGTALDVGWLYVEPKSCERILTSLEWWRTDGKTAQSFEEMLPMLEDTDSNILNKVGSADRDTLLARKKEAKAKFIRELKSPEYLQQTKTNAAKNGQTLAQYIADWESMPDDEFNKLNRLQMSVPKAAMLENMLYPDLGILVPPAGIEEPKQLEDKVFKPIRNNDHNLRIGMPPEEIRERFIANRWSINYTKLDANWILQRNRIEQSPFSACMNLFGEGLDHLSDSSDKGGLYSVSSRFFWLVAAGFRKMKSHLKIEVILGDGFAVMDEIRMETLTRSENFPVLFDRIHASNVPDYAGGYLAAFTSATPLLKSHPQAYFTACNLLNASVWEGGMTRKDLYGLTMSSQIHTYTGAVLSDIESAFGVAISGECLSPVEYHMFRRLDKVPRLLPRDDLTSVATACFWRTVMPSPYKKLMNCGMQVRETVNVHSFFRALESWMKLGYPHHLLADLVERILENRLERSVTPHDTAPAPVAGRKKPLGPICTLPFIAEFEVAATLWEPKLFPIASKAMISVTDVRRYSVKIRFRQIPLLAHVPTTHMILLLVFGLPRDMDAVSMDVRSKLVKSPWKSSLQFVSTFEYDSETSTCTVLLSKDRLKAFVKGGYEVGLLSIAGWKIQSSKVPCSAMVDVGNVDNWDRTVEVSQVEGREMTNDQVDAWSASVMPMMGGLGGLGGMGGMGMMDGLPKANKLLSDMAELAGQGGPGCPTQ